MSERLIGQVVHYFQDPRVAVVHVTDGELHPGDRIHVLGHTSDFVEEVTSMEVEHHKVQAAGMGDEVAVQVIERVREHDQVFKIVP